MGLLDKRVKGENEKKSTVVLSQSFSSTSYMNISVKGEFIFFYLKLSLLEVSSTFERCLKHEVISAA